MCCLRRIIILIILFSLLTLAYSSVQLAAEDASTQTGRIVVTEWDIGRGNLFKPKGSFAAQVFGENVSKIKLYGLDHLGNLTELKTLSCEDGSTVTFKFKYDRFETKYFELRLYDNNEEVIATHKRENKE